MLDVRQSQTDTLFGWLVKKGWQQVGGEARGQGRRHFVFLRIVVDSPQPNSTKEIENCEDNRVDIYLLLSDLEIV